MNSKEVLELHNKHLKNITKDKESWEDFLQYISENYKFSFENLVLLHNQKASDKYYSTESKWKKQGFALNENAKSIFMLNKKLPVRLYSVNDTNGAIENKYIDINNTLNYLDKGNRFTHYLGIIENKATELAKTREPNFSDLTDDELKLYVNSFTYIASKQLCEDNSLKEFEFDYDKLQDLIANDRINIVGKVIVETIQESVQELGKLMERQQQK